MPQIVVVILSCLLVGSCFGSLCGTGSLCRIPEWDLRAASGGLNDLQHEPAARYLSVQIQRLLVGAAPMDVLLVNASKIADALLFKKFHETKLQLASALTLKELVVWDAAALREFSAQTNTFLDRLEVETCALAVLPPSVRNLVKLRYLTIKSCQLKMLNLALLANLRHLEVVMFDGNQISAIHPPQASVVLNLHTLNLSQNQLKQLNMTSLASLKQVRTLAVAHNRLAEVSYGLQGAVAFPRLTILDLSYNVLQSVALGQLGAPNLEHLLLSHNELSSVPGPLQRFPKLTTLVLKHNALESFSFALLRGLNDLKSLELSENRLQTLDASDAVQLPRLELLMIANNELKSVNLAKQALPRLSTVDLSFNLLTNVPPGVFEHGVNGLHMVTVTGNPLTCASLEHNRAYIQKEVLIPKWLMSDAEVCSTGKMFVLDDKRRACCAP